MENYDSVPYGLRILFFNPSQFVFFIPNQCIQLVDWAMVELMLSFSVLAY